jgi:hypothetical protein
MPELRAQRTLVKSPPELWAQLSDPVSLSRHLGEFGEIRITRVVPEQTVAWEGERASGTVELSSSGWGTKVTLVAQLTDDADRASDPEPAAAEAPPSETRPADAFELINSLAREPLPHTPEPLGADDAEPDRSAAVEAGPEEPLAAVQAAPEEPLAAVDAAPEEPPALVDEPHEYLDPPGEHVEEPDEAADATVDQEHGHELDPWFSHSPGPAADQTGWPAPATAAAAAGARPGFFARLFGRRKVATSPATQLAKAPQPTGHSPHDDPGSPAPISEPEATPTEAEAAWTEHEATPTATETASTEHEVASTVPETPTYSEATSTEHEAMPTVPETASTEHEAASTVPETPTDSEATWTEHEVAPAEAEPKPEPEPAAEPTGTEPEPDHEAAAPADDPVETLDHARAEAVLTAVLDDLGAARHRPFSRG